MMQTSEQLIAEAHRLIGRAEHNGFNRETEARVTSLIRLAELTRASDFQPPNQFGRPRSPAGLATEAYRQYLQRTIDPATIEFFCGREPKEEVISVSGGRIEKLGDVRFNGRSRGAVTVLRDFSSALDPEARTYSGLTTATGGGDGGNTVPIGFIPTVFAAMKRTDQILEAANWDTAATADGRPTNLPSLTDTSTSAVKVGEGGAMTFANPTFGNMAWPEATTWTSQVIQASVQLDVDAGVRLAGLLADAFRIRFARGFGAECVNILLGDVPVGATANNTPPDEFDLMNLMGSVDSAYAASGSAGFAMNWATFLAVVKTISTTGEGNSTAAYVLPKDDRGHYLLFGKPVYISPSLPDIALSPTPSMPILFGDWSRFLVHHVPTEAVIRRYSELYMANMQFGYEMLFRADAKVMHAGGSGDDPIKALVM